MGHSANISGAESMTHDFADSILFLTIIIGIINVVGIFGNICVLYVYSTKYPRCNFKYFVVSLALIDLIACVTTLPAEVYIQRNWFSMPNSAEWLCKTKTYFNGFTVFISAFLLLLISVDRFRKVCRPLAWQIKPRRAIQLCGMIYGLALVLASPALLLWGKQTANITYHNENITIAICEKDDSYKNTNWPSIFIFFVFFTPTIVFILATSVLYGLIMKEIFCGSLALKSISRQPSPREMKTSENESKFTEASVDGESTVTGNSTVEMEDDSDIATKKSDTEKQQSKFTVTKSRTRLQSAKVRLRTKTIIMFILTTIFATTTVTYFVILSYVASKNNVYVLEMIDKGIAIQVIFFLMRLYFINHVINPIVYGILDLRFREALKSSFCVRKLYGHYKMNATV